MGSLILFLGPTGAGKSTQAERLARELGYVHLSSGNLLRQDLHGAQVLASGELVPSGEVEQIVGQAIRETDDSATIILDGFPRTVDEAIWLLHRLPSWERTIIHVVLFEVEQNTSSKRLAQRKRADDTADAQRKKWNEYHTQTEPMIEWFSERDQLVTIDGNGSPDEVYAELEDIMS